MKYALVDGNKAEATPKAKGICPNCESELIARCGKVKVWHWAHKGNPPCDPWWENETEWHRAWKGQFPVDWQEVIHRADDGEKHIADVKTDQGWVLEFQHSYLKPEERQSRNEFYKKLVWIIDGTRRKTDIMQFNNILEESKILEEKTKIRKIYYPEESRLLKEWMNGKALVFFDFNDMRTSLQYRFWLLLPIYSSNNAYLMPISRESLKNHRFLA